MSGPASAVSGRRAGFLWRARPCRRRPGRGEACSACAAVTRASACSCPVGAAALCSRRDGGPGPTDPVLSGGLSRWCGHVLHQGEWVKRERERWFGAVSRLLQPPHAPDSRHSDRLLRQRLMPAANRQARTQRCVSLHGHSVRSRVRRAGRRLLSADRRCVHTALESRRLKPAVRLAADVLPPTLSLCPHPLSPRPAVRLAADGRSGYPVRGHAATPAAVESAGWDMVVPRRRSSSDWHPSLDAA